MNLKLRAIFGGLKSTNTGTISYSIIKAEDGREYVGSKYDDVCTDYLTKDVFEELYPNGVNKILRINSIKIKDFSNPQYYDYELIEEAINNSEGLPVLACVDILESDINHLKDKSLSTYIDCVEKKQKFWESLGFQKFYSSCSTETSFGMIKY